MLITNFVRKARLDDTTQLGKRLIFSIASVCAVLAILLFVPISFGTLRYLEVYPNGREHSINLSRPEYLIPRELYTSGYPFLGGDFGFFDDQAAFLIPLEYGGQNSQKILLVSWPPRSETGIVITSDDRERWDSLLETLRGSQYVVVEHLCLSQQKSAHSFFRDITGDFCPDS